MVSVNKQTDTITHNTTIRVNITLQFSNSRGLDSMTQILDSIADAIIKYDKLEDNEVGQTRKSKDL